MSIDALCVENIGRFPVVNMDKLREQYPEKFNESGAMDYRWFESEIRPNFFIYIIPSVNSVSFVLGGVSQAGSPLAGCGWQELVEAARLIATLENERLSASKPVLDICAP